MIEVIFEERNNDHVSADENYSQFMTSSSGVEKEIDSEGDILILSEADIPGASLNNKDPSELNVVQLKRWLSCRGAPLTGKKPELIAR